MTDEETQRIALERIAEFKRRRAAEAAAEEAKKPKAPVHHERPAIAMTAEELRQIRKAIDLTQAQMAPRLRVSLRQYKRFEQTGIPLQGRLRAETARRMKPRKSSVSR